MTRFLSAVCALFWVAFLPPGAEAATVTASTADTLWTALKTANPGDTVQIGAGTYPALRFDGFVKAAPGVTVQPAPGTHPILGGVALNNSQGFTFVGLEVSISDPAVSYGVTVNGGANLTFDRMTVHQATGTHGLGGGVGFFVRSSTDIAITNSDAFNLGVGASLMDDVRASVRASRFHDLETDGIDLAGDVDPIIDGNTFTDFYPAPDDHPDGIQFWATTAHPLGTGAMVTNNVIRRGLGGPMPMQGIFAENQANMTVRGNAMSCTLYNGISLSGVATALIEANWVQACSDIGSRIIARDGSSDITVKDNQLTDKVVNLVQAGSAPTVRFVETGSVAIPQAATPVAGLAADTSAMDAWIKARGTVTPTPVPPVVVPVTPPVVVDSRDAIIADLTAKLSASTAKITALKKSLTSIASTATAAAK